MNQMGAFFRNVLTKNFENVTSEDMRPIMCAVSVTHQNALWVFLTPKKVSYLFSSSSISQTDIRYFET